MTCSNCAMGVKKALERKGLEDAYVNFSTGKVIFSERPEVELTDVKRTIEGLGYKVVEEQTGREYRNLVVKVVFSAVLSLPLLLAMGHAQAQAYEAPATGISEQASSLAEAGTTP